MKKIRLVLVALAIVTPSYALARSVDISLATSTTTVAINNSYVGLSDEIGIAVDHIPYAAENAGMIALYKRLGTGVLRLGGDSVDSTQWVPNGPGRTWEQINKADIDRLAGFLNATGWKVIFGINLGRNTVPNISAEAAYAAQSLGGHLYALSIGNEPDLYFRNGIRYSSYTYTNFRTEWEQAANAIKQTAPSASISGPDGSSDATFSSALAVDEASRLLLVTQHYNVSQPHTITPANIMESLFTDDGFARMLRTKDSAAVTSTSIRDGFRLDEVGVFNGGGLATYSNSFGTALWAIDFLFRCAQTPGCTGINVHGGSEIGTPIMYTDVGAVSAVNPDYYGLYIFSMMADGNLFTPSVTNSTTTLSTYAVAMHDGSTSVVISNKNTTESVTATLHNLGQSQQATTLLLTAPSLFATTQVSLGGSPINLDGSWAGSTHPQPVTNGQTTVTVPPASVLLVRTQLAGTVSDPCDVNKNGLVNVADVQAEVTMALGISSCTNPGKTCTALQVQKVVNAALGGSCPNL